MQRIMLRAKIHRATVTETHLHYEGSLAVDADLLAAADILPGERIQFVNLANGARAETYILEAPAGSGTIGLQGAAARLGEVGDALIIFAFSLLDEAEARAHQPTVVHVDERDRATPAP